jgi:hypothetical protein
VLPSGGWPGNDEAKDAQPGPQGVNVPAAKHGPQHQRVDRPQQVGAGARRRVSAQQPVKHDCDAGEREGEQQLQPEDDAAD